MRLVWDEGPAWELMEVSDWQMGNFDKLAMGKPAYFCRGLQQALKIWPTPSKSCYVVSFEGMRWNFIWGESTATGFLQTGEPPVMNETETLIQRLLKTWKTAEARRDRVAAERAKRELLTAYDADRKQQEAQAKRAPWERAANELRENWQRLGEVVGNPTFSDSIIPLETEKKVGDTIRYPYPAAKYSVDLQAQATSKQQRLAQLAQQYQPGDADKMAFGGATKYWSQADRDAWFGDERKSIVNNKPAPKETPLPEVIDRSKFIRRIKLD